MQALGLQAHTGPLPRRDNLTRSYANAQLPQQLPHNPTYTTQNPSDFTQGVTFFSANIDPGDLYLDFYKNVIEKWPMKLALEMYQHDSTFVNGDLRANPPVVGMHASTLDKIMNHTQLPRVPKSFKVYRCYHSWATVAKLDDPANANKIFMSTSLAREFSENWCGEASPKATDFTYQNKKERIIDIGKKIGLKGGLMITIVIPMGSTGVLPILLGGFANQEQNEVLLDRKGRIVNTGKVDEHNYPIYVYIHDPTAQVPPLSDFPEIFPHPDRLMHQNNTNTGGRNGRRSRRRRGFRR